MERRDREVTIRKVLSIAGSDSGGGAGIQADLKTFAALGVHGMTAVTAITAQNTLGVTAIQGVEPSIIKAQIDAVVTDIGVDTVKTGMLHSVEVIMAVAEKIEEYGLPAVVDPVMVATSGAELLKPEAITSLVDRLLPLATVLTPNVHEAMILSGIEIKSLDDAKEAAERIAALGPKAVLVKGGHLALDKAVDILYSGGEFTVLEAPLYDTVNTHGTGCSLSSAIAAQIAKGDGIVEAVTKAKMFVNRGIKYGLDIGEGPGPLNPMAGLYNEAEKSAVIEDIREAVAMVEASPGMRGLVAECQMNISMALSYAVGPMDVAAVDGRLTRRMDCVRAAGCPRFGASRHIANTILAVMEFDERKRAALNLKYSAEIVEACKAVGLTVSYYDRREEPEEIKRMEGMTTRWGAGEAVKRAGETPDVIYHLGDWGKEPMVVLVGETATQVAGWAIQVMERLGDD